MIKPKAVEMYPVYICDDCSSRHCETLDYVNKIGKILCGCGGVLDLTPIETFKVSPVFKTISRNIKHGSNAKPEEIQDNDFLVVKVNEQPESPPSIQTKNEKPNSFTIIEKDYYDQAVELLVSLGWQKTESKKKVDDCVKSWMEEKDRVSIGADNFDEFAKRIMFGKT